MTFLQHMTGAVLGAGLAAATLWSCDQRARVQAEKAPVEAATTIVLIGTFKDLHTAYFGDGATSQCSLYRFYDAERVVHGVGYIVKCNNTVSIATSKP